jgi:hypothetical protein
MTSLFQLFFFSIALLLFTNSTIAQNCLFNLIVKNNIESVNNEGRVYFLEILNLSNEELEIDLSISNNNIGKNPDESSSVNNVNLFAELLNENGAELNNKVNLNSREAKKFQVKVSVPEGTPIEHWNSLLVVAKSKNCIDNAKLVTLYTFIPNTEQ